MYLKKNIWRLIGYNRMYTLPQKKRPRFHGDVLSLERDNYFTKAVLLSHNGFRSLRSVRQNAFMYAQSS